MSRHRQSAQPPTPAPVLRQIEAFWRQPPADGVLRIEGDEIKLSRFPEACLDLPGLTRVTLRDHALTEWPASVSQLTERGVVLDVRHNPLRRLPPGDLPTGVFQP